MDVETTEEGVMGKIIVSPALGLDSRPPSFLPLELNLVSVPPFVKRPPTEPRTSKSEL